jgi:polar amino acid transport system substrate-binding protein
VAGYYYGAEFARLMKDPAFAAHVEGATDYPINIRKLLYRRIDGFLVDNIGVMVGEMNNLGITDRLERYPLRIAAERLHLMFSKKSVDPSIVRAVNASLAKMKADGRLQSIMDRFLN